MIEYILFVIGLVFLVKGADFLVGGSSALAKRLGIPTLVIGLTIVAFGTSTPELVVNLISAIKGQTEVAFGNIIGSNIANILLVLGIVAIINPIKVKRSTVYKEIPFSLLAVVVLFVVSNYLLIDNISINSLTRVSGIVLLCFFIIFLYYSIGLAQRSRKQLDNKEMEIKKYKPWTSIFFILLGLVGLYFGGQWVVNGAVFIAEKLGLSEFMISATVIAIGTSLPELVTGITAARKKESDLAVGNSVGSNIFNVFWILGITAVVAPVFIPGFINLDMLFLGISTVLLFVFLFIGKRHEIERWQGILFVLIYVAYIVFLVLRG